MFITWKVMEATAAQISQTFIVNRDCGTIIYLQYNIFEITATTFEIILRLAGNYFPTYTTK